MFKILSLIVLYLIGVYSESGGLSDLVARFNTADVTTKGPNKLDSLLDSYEDDRESTHHKSWMKLDGHRHKSLTSLMDKFYPRLTTPGYKLPEQDDLIPFIDSSHVTTSNPRLHRHSQKSKHSDEERTTPGPSFDSEIELSERKSDEPRIQTRHHHRYHRGDGTHQLQADSTFSQPSVSGYYDYAANGGSSSSPSKFQSTRLSSLDWKKTARRVDRNRWTSTSKNIGITPAKSDGENDVGAHRLASLHVKAAKEMICKLPQPKIIRITDHYPSADKMYFPSCTRLHQCAQDTGCCPPSKKCGPKSTQKVELYFYSTTIKAGNAGNSRQVQVEKLPFYNHTECECQDRNDEMPRDKEQLSSNAISSVYDLDTAERNVCLCPSEFTLKFLPNGQCACDCFDKQKECTKYKRGKEYFNHKDKLCIAMNKCVTPMCDYGTYNRNFARCPRKHERHKTRWSSLYN